MKQGPRAFVAFPRSLRTLTEQQFSDGTTIDGDRIEAAMADFQARWNGLRKGDVRARWVQEQIVCGWQPQADWVVDTPAASPAGSAYMLHSSYPWLRSKNDGAWVNPVGNDVVNRERLKGYRAIGDVLIDDTGDNATGHPSASGWQWNWELAWSLDEPSILWGLSLIMLSDTSASVIHGIDFDGISAGDYVDDWSLHVLVDSPFAPEDRRHASPVYTRFRCRAKSHRINVDTASYGGAFTADLVPTHPGGRIDGLAIIEEHLNIPLPPGARVRIALVIPAYPDAVDGNYAWHEPGSSTRDNAPATPNLTWVPLTNSCPNLTATLLRELRP